MKIYSRVIFLYVFIIFNNACNFIRHFSVEDVGGGRCGGGGRVGVNVMLKRWTLS